MDQAVAASSDSALNDCSKGQLQSDALDVIAGQKRRRSADGELNGGSVDADVTPSRRIEQNLDLGRPIDVAATSIPTSAAASMETRRDRCSQPRA